MNQWGVCESLYFISQGCPHSLQNLQLKARLSPFTFSQNRFHKALSFNFDFQIYSTAHLMILSYLSTRHCRRCTRLYLHQNDEAIHLLQIKSTMCIFKGNNIFFSVKKQVLYFCCYHLYNTHSLLASSLHLF